VAGEALAHKVDMGLMRWIAAGLFVAMGGLALLA
jgi:putative Ca2+/H+ antiporter (TMEM165/GDT1 family)